ncbi:MAG: HypC/HybG/HupF family hydrogenase formation chaperone [Chloroflexia bacterium]|nr:HypC/HybG/HupF family hydrogenase formation chaperone [Chloroflexia bacterium]
MPGQIVALAAEGSDLVQVAIGGARYDAKLGLWSGDPLAVDDWVLVYAGYIYERIGAAEAAAVLELIAGMDQVLLDAFADAPGAVSPVTGEMMPAASQWLNTS